MELTNEFGERQIDELRLRLRNRHISLDPDPLLVSSPPAFSCTVAIIVGASKVLIWSRKEVLLP